LVAAGVALSASLLTATPARADAFRWSQPDGLGSPILLTYSFVNLLDLEFTGSLTEAEIRSATAEALGLWSSYVPLHFFERSDSGPAPADSQYAPDSYPDIRIGYHLIDDDTIAAHAFLPWDTEESGLAGDIHLNPMTAFAWSLGGSFPALDFLEVITHEIGHALGVGHILYAEAIMQPFHANRFSGLGTGYLLGPDIQAIQALYGTGVGSVHPIPEPSTVLLLAAGILAMAWRSRQPRRYVASPEPVAAR
jgi:hypothetical protein